MTNRCFLVVALTFGLVIATFFMAGVSVNTFIDIPSLAVVVGPAVLLGFAAHSPREVERSYRLAFSESEGSRRDLEQAAAYFDGLARYLAYGGAIGVVTGIVAILVSVKDAASARRAVRRAAHRGRGGAFPDRGPKEARYAREVAEHGRTARGPRCDGAAAR